jgi:uncharacterized protein with HEPN domain
MRQHDREAFLWEMLQAANAIQGFLAGKSFEEYENDLLLRSGVERQFEIIGEALGQALRSFPELESSITDAARIVAFRNKLIHGYAVVSDHVVWAIAHDELVRLAGEVETLIHGPSTARTENSSQRE